MRSFSLFLLAGSITFLIPLGACGGSSSETPGTPPAADAGQGGTGGVAGSGGTPDGGTPDAYESGTGGDSAPPSDTGADVTVPTAAPEILDATPVSARNVRLRWQPISGVEVVIERSQDLGGSWQEVARKPGDHGRLLDLGLMPETGYQYRLGACTSAGCGPTAETGTVATPFTQLPPLNLTVPANDGDEKVVLFATYPSGQNIGPFGQIAGVDREGNILWEFARTQGGPIFEVDPLEDRTIVMGQRGKLVHVDLDGTELLRYDAFPVHHDVDRLSDGRFVFLIFDVVDVFPGGPYLGDGIQILNNDGVTVDWSWLGADHIPTTDVNPIDIQRFDAGLGYDWTHSNALTFDETEQKVYLNVRNLNRIYKIDVATGGVDWVMGDGGDFGEGLWDHSHDPQFLADDRVLIFDNGTQRPERYSRAIEVQFDPVAGTAEIIWEYRETPDFFARAFGSAQLEENGNILITDGTNGRVVEVTRAKAKVWELRAGNNFRIYKATTVPRDALTGW